MTEHGVVTKRGHVELALDAGLFTAGLFAATTSLVLGAVMLIGPVAVPDWLLVAGQLLGSLSTLVVMIGGPMLAWWLHRRRFGVVAVLGGVLGAGVAALVAGAGAVLSIPLGWLVTPISTSEFAGPIALLVLVAAAFLGSVIWLLLDAAKDSRAGCRLHVRIDAVRLACVLALAALIAIVVSGQLANPSGEMGEAVIFAMVFGIAGGLTVAGADLLVSLVDRREPRAPEVAA